MSEASDPPHDAGHRRKRRRRSPDEKMLEERIEAHVGAKQQPADPAHLRSEMVQSKPQPQSASAPAGSAAASFAGHPLVKGCFRWLKIATRTTVILYLLGLAGIALAMDRLGQSNLTTAALMYLPPWPLLAPTFFLMLPALIFDWKSVPALLLAIGLFVMLHLDYQWRPEREPGPPKPFESLRVLSWNRGQGKRVSLSTLKGQFKPDFILLQDASGRGKGYRGDKNYGEFGHIAEIGEFVLLSRWPILSASGVVTRPATDSLTRGNPRAAKFIVLAAGTRVTIYSVHLPSPRDVLESYKGGSFLWGILGIPGTPFESKKLHYQAFWDDQIALANEIHERIQSEEGPLLVIGDFNTPPMGPIYQKYAATLQDAHRVAGSGLGFTFPGDTGNPLALFDPWLRLDQMFVSSHWQVLHCSPRPAQAQHLPVFAEFKLANPSN